MKILHVITGLPKAAGTSVFCGEVANGLATMGHDVTIAVVNPDAPNLYPLDERVKLVSISSILTTNQLMTNDYNVVHIHGLWLPILHKVSAWAKGNNIPIVWSTHGMTAPWSMRHKWWKKLPAWLLYQRKDLKSADVIHCTTNQEVEWNRALGLKKCFIAPLGTQLPEIHSHNPIHHNIQILLFVGRIYPVKGLVNLVKAWGLCKPRSWKLRIVGPDQAGHRAELEVLSKEMGLCDSIEFVGPRYGKGLSQEYDRCDCLVLPSFTENFGATVVDALARGKPCIASAYTPWGDLPRCGCGWWVSNEPLKLSQAINEAMSLSDEERAAMGARGRKLVEEKYTWKAVVSAMVKGYEEILNSIPNPILGKQV